MKKLFLLLVLLPLYAGAINQWDLDNQLLEAAWQGSVEQVYGLLKAGANKDAAHEHGRTPLHLAAAYNHLDIVKLLLTAGADSNSADYNGETPLHRAARYGYTDIVRLLLEKGANPNVKNRSRNETPLCLTAFGRQDNTVLDINIDVIKLLLAHGADHLSEDINGYTILDWDPNYANANDSEKAAAQILKYYAHALSLQHQTLIPAKLPAEIAYLIARYTL